MAQVRVRKPLYEDNNNTPSTTEGNGGAPAPGSGPIARPARAPKLARVAALGLDFVVIQGLLHATVTFVFDAVVGFGVAGPFIGWALALLYFTLGYSSFTGGRTLGKFVMRLRVAALDGLSLNFGPALLRAFLLLWPILIYASVDVYAKLYEGVSEYSMARAVTYVGIAMVASWFLGSFAHAVFEPNGRSFADRVIGSVVVSLDAVPDDYAAYMNDVRADNGNPKRLASARMWLMIVAAAMPGYAAFTVYQQYKTVVNRPAAEREESRRAAQDFYMPDFYYAGAVEAIAPGTPDKLASDKATTTIVYQYRHYGRLNPDVIKQSELARQKPAAITRMLVESIRTAQKETTEPLRGALSNLRVYVSFAEYADLTFAFRPREVMGFAETHDFSVYARPQDMITSGGNIMSAEEFARSTGTTATLTADTTTSTTTADYATTLPL